MNALKEEIINSFRNEFTQANLTLEQSGIETVSQNTINSIVNIIDTIISNQIEQTPNELTLNQLKKDAVHCKAA